MLAISTAFSAWVSIVAFPTLSAPRFFGGYIMEAVLQVTYVNWTAGIVWDSNREDKLKKEKTAEGPQIAE
jgi:hypothetical protein